jgi:hypothetical protein
MAAEFCHNAAAASSNSSGQASRSHAINRERRFMTALLHSMVHLLPRRENKFALPAAP